MDSDDSVVSLYLRQFEGYRRKHWGSRSGIPRIEEIPQSYSRHKTRRSSVSHSNASSISREAFNFARWCRRTLKPAFSFCQFYPGMLTRSSITTDIVNDYVRNSGNTRVKIKRKCLAAMAGVQHENSVPSHQRNSAWPRVRTVTKREPPSIAAIVIIIIFIIVIIIVFWTVRSRRRQCISAIYILSPFRWYCCSTYYVLCCINYL